MRKLLHPPRLLVLTASMTMTACYGIDFPHPPDPVVEARALRHLHTHDEAKNALWRQDYGIAEETFLKAMTEDNSYGEKPSAITHGFLRFVYVAQGRYREAIEAENMWQGLLDASSGWKDAMLDDRLTADLYLAQGNDRAALERLEHSRKDLSHYVETAIERMKAANEENERKRRKSWMESGSSTIDLKSTEKSAREGMESRTARMGVHWGKYHLVQGEYEQAKRSFQESIDLFLKPRMDRASDAVHSRMLLGVACYYAGEDDKAAEILLGAGKANAASFVVEEEDLALTLTTLMRLAEHKGDTERALAYGNSAIRKLRDGGDAVKLRTQQADVFNQLGTFHMRRGHPTDAVRAFLEAKTLREQTVTATHPAYADILKGLADADAFRNLFMNAVVSARRSLEVLDASVLPTHRRTASVLVALAALETLTDHPEQAAPLHARLDTILQKSLGIWTEDFLWTVHYYAAILEKAGKTDEARYLKDIDERQIARR